MQMGTRDGYGFYLNGGSAGSINTNNLKDSVPFLNDVLQHGTYDDFWKARNILPHLKNIKPAMMTVSGWYDANNLYGALHVYQTIEQSTPGSSNVLVIGPWSHGQWARGTGTSLGDVSFGSATSEFFRDSIQAVFYRERLKGEAGAKLPEAYIFETGTNRWRTFDSWPPKGTTSKALYLHEQGGLSFDPPKADDGLRLVPERPLPPGAVHRAPGLGSNDRLHDPGPALRVAASGRARVRERAPHRGRDDRRPGEAQLLGGDERHGPGLGREVDRRLSRRRAREGSAHGDRAATPRGVDGRVSAARERRRAARKVPEQPRETGAPGA